MHKSMSKCGLSGTLRLNVIFVFERFCFLDRKNHMLRSEREDEVVPSVCGVREDVSCLELCHVFFCVIIFEPRNKPMMVNIIVYCYLHLRRLNESLRMFLAAHDGKPNSNWFK